MIDRTDFDLPLFALYLIAKIWGDGIAPINELAKEMDPLLAIEEPPQDLSGVAQFLKKHTASGEDQTWTLHHYNEQFGQIPELEELTK